MMVDLSDSIKNLQQNIMYNNQDDIKNLKIEIKKAMSSFLKRKLELDVNSKMIES